MKMKRLFNLLCLLSTLFKGVCPRPTVFRDVFAIEGEIVILKYSHNDYDRNPSWTYQTVQELDLTNQTSVERQMPVLINRKNLAILNVSSNLQGNYSVCSLGRNTSGCDWFNLTVYPKMLNASQYPITIKYKEFCFQGQSCSLPCPAVLKSFNITPNNTAWQKENASLPIQFRGYFNSVDVEDSGWYTCIQSYQYLGHLYNITRIMYLDVNNDRSYGQSPMIISPQDGQVFHVDLDLPFMIDCKAIMIDFLDDIYWMKGNVLLDSNPQMPVHYNYTTVNELNIEQRKGTASLIFRKVSSEDLSNNYTCKLDSTSLTSNVTIFLAPLMYPPSSSLTLGIVGFLVIISITSAVIYARFKIDITLFLRDSLRCYGSTSDGKHYDAFIMCYKSDTAAGLSDEERRWLEEVLEEKLCYKLCLYDRDVSPGAAVAEAVLGCIEQSRRVVLIPSCQDPGTHSGLLSAIHTAVVERQTSLVLIKTEPAVAAHPGPQQENTLPETLRLIAMAGHSVTWRGRDSQPHSSSFWKELRYHLPAPQSLRTRDNAEKVCISLG